MRNEAMAALSEEGRAKMRHVFERSDGPAPMFMLLRESEKQDILHGRCVYRQHEGVPILDYS